MKRTFFRLVNIPQCSRTQNARPGHTRFCLKWNSYEYKQCSDYALFSSIERRASTVEYGESSVENLASGNVYVTSLARLASASKAQFLTLIYR